MAALCLLISTTIALSQPTGSTSSGLNVAKKGIWPTKTCSVCWENPLPAFAVGLDGAAYHQYFENGAWSEWMSLGGDFKFSPLPIMAATSLSTVSWGKNHLDVYGCGTDGAVYQKWWNESKGKWEGWNNLGGNIMGAPVAVSWGGRTGLTFSVSERTAVFSTTIGT